MSTEFFDGHRKVKPLDEQADFVMSFVDDSREARTEIEDIWEETEQNFLVRPYYDQSFSGATNLPLHSNLREASSSHGRNMAVLKDPETHQQVMTLASKVVLALFPESQFISAKGVGFEDVLRAKVVSDLLAYVHRLPNHFVVFLEWVIGAGVYGTSILDAFWLYREEARNRRAVEVTPYGDEVSTMTPYNVPVYDDVRYSTTDIRDFFPDPGNTRMDDMLGAAKRFKMSGAQAMREVERGRFDRTAVENAIYMASSSDAAEMQDKPTEDASEMTHRRESYHEYVTLVGFEFYGETPFKAEGSDRPLEEVRRRVITILNGQTARSEGWPRRLPFFDMRFIPRNNSFWGIAPAEVIRFDQDFSDMVKMMLADAVVRSTHPPLIYNKYGDVDYAKLLRFNPDVPVGADLRQQPQAVYQLPYNPPVQDAFIMYSGVKQQMREATGALGAVQGLGLGTKRFSASEAVQTFQQAMDKPELFARVIEQEYLPPLGKYTLSLYQEFLEDSEDLRKRVGETEAKVFLADILPEFDVQFIGSRNASTVQQELAAFREIVQASANPIIMQLVPWIPLLQKWFERIGAPGIAAMVGNPQLVKMNVMLNQIGVMNSLSGNANGTTPRREPVGTLPAQAEGGISF
jgi:hypothetical protein